jgi:hypothetical protein
LPCTAVILLPYCGFSLQSSKYFLPGPLGFMISTGFFRGDAYKTDSSTNEKLMTFQKIPGNVIALLFAITLFIAVAMIAVILMKHTNVWCAKKRCHRVKPICFILTLCVVVSSLSGCGTKSGTQLHSVYNMELNGAFENQKYQFYVSNASSDESEILFKNKATGKVQNLVRDPMQSLVEVPGSIYGDGNYVYYMRYDYEDTDFWGKTADKFSVIRVDTSNFDEKAVFEKNLNTNNSSFLNLVESNDTDNSFYAQITEFFVDDHYFYFFGNDQIRKVDRLTGQMSVIIESSVLKTVAFDGKTIYYINSKSTVTEYDTKTGKESELPHIVTTSFLLTGDKMVFLNRRDQNRIYVMERKSGTIRKLTDESALSFTLDGETIVYISKTDLKEHKINADKK